MKIANLFEKDIFRPVNGVVKAEQNDADIVWQELDEYVVTKELDRHFRSFFSVYTDTLQKASDSSAAGRMGVWISGFFGSGKSHFLKILSYLLSNHKAINPQDLSSRTATNFFDETKISDPLLRGNILAAANVPTDVVLFNIDSRADANDGAEAILGVFWRVFNEMQGYCADDRYLAAMEKYLTEQGRYAAFMEKYEELVGEAWKESRDTWRFHRDEVISALSSALNQSEESAAQWFDDDGKSFVLSIENFAKDVRRYLDSKGKNHRIIFLVDEVGQFIGSDTKRMLQLQTITENLGTHCGARAWVIVTSQEDIESVLGEFKTSKANDFSKIQGRFSTKLSLSSSNTDEVIQYRLLRKTPTASAELRKIYAEKGDILRSQLSFTHDCATLKNFTTEDDFIKNYPFAPYHFQLIQKVFESIRKAGVTGAHLSRGERSMLDAFQSATRSIAENNCTALVPLYEFYPAIESFLDTAVKATIDKALENTGLQQPLDGHLLKTLFLIRYVDILKPNVDNLVTLFISEIDTDKLALKRNIEASLQRLEKETLINRNGELYYFLTNEERDISREIKRIDVSLKEQTQFLASLIFDDTFRSVKSYRYKEYKRDYDFHRLMDSCLYASHGENELSVDIITQFNDDFSLLDEARCVLLSSQNPGRIFFKLDEIPLLEKESLTWLQTAMYLRNPSVSRDNPTLEKILKTLQDENTKRRARLVELLNQSIPNASIYTLGKCVQLTQSERASAKSVLEGALSYLIQNSYSRFSLLQHLQDNPQTEIKAVLTSNTIGQTELIAGLTTVNSGAVQDIEEYLRLQREKADFSVQDLQNHYLNKPYGWPEWEIILLIARLYMAGTIEIILEGTSDIRPRDVAESILSVRRWNTIKVRLRHKPAEEDVRKAKKLYHELAGKLAQDTPDAVVGDFHALFSAWLQQVSNWKQIVANGVFPQNTIISRCEAAILPLSKIHDPACFLQSIVKSSNDLRDVLDDRQTLDGFFRNQRAIWNSLISALDEFKRSENSLRKNARAAQALNRLTEIRFQDEPYGNLHEVSALIADVTAIRDAELATEREKAQTDLAQEIELLQKSLDALKSNADTCNTLLHPLQELRAKLATAPSVPDISYIVNYDIAEALQSAKEAVFELQSPQIPAKPNTSTPVVKTERVKAAQYAGHKYLTSTQDVEAYTEKLKAALLEKLKENVRLMVE